MKMLRNGMLALCLVAGLAVPGTSRAEGDSLTVALKAGGGLPMFSGLSTTVQTEGEVGIYLLGGRMDLSLTVGYARPPASHATDDPRFEGGSYSWSMQQDILAVGLLGRYRFMEPGSAFNAYGALGPRMYMLRTTVNGTSGEAALGENRQYDTQAGLATALGAELSIGPGALLAELHFGAGPLQGLVTGDVSASSLGLMAGYRLSF
jgi:hypothetical protein